MSTPLVSVLMTAYNAENYVEEAILSIINQTYGHWELLISDDCSTDNTRRLIDKFKDPRIRTYHNERNLHYLRTRNKLAEKIKGEFITLLDADDTCLPSRLEQQLNAFEQDNSLGMCGCLVHYVDKSGESISLADNKPFDYNSILDQIKDRNVFTGSTVMIRSEVWKSIGGYRDFFNAMGYEDYDLTSRIVERFPAINLNEALYIYRQYPGSTSKKNLLYNPFKLHGDKLVQLLISERQEFGHDSLEVGDYPKIINHVLTLHKPYIDDPSTIYRHYMWANLNRSFTMRALKSALTAILLKPFVWSNWKTLILFLLVKCGVVKQ